MSYIDQLPKVLYDLAYHIGQYKRGFLRRNVVTEAVCDAIEGFCDEGCVWQRIEYGTDQGWFMKGHAEFAHSHYIEYINGQLCSRCNRRIIEQFDILKEEGV